MNKKELLSTMNDFIFGKTQVLLSTSIIESGIDIGLANTIIINNAHMFGLSQLYHSEEGLAGPRARPLPGF